MNWVADITNSSEPVPPRSRCWVYWVPIPSRFFSIYTFSRFHVGVQKRKNWLAMKYLYNISSLVSPMIAALHLILRWAAWLTLRCSSFRNSLRYRVNVEFSKSPRIRCLLCYVASNTTEYGRYSRLLEKISKGRRDWYFCGCRGQLYRSSTRPWVFHVPKLRAIIVLVLRRFVGISPSPDDVVVGFRMVLGRYVL